MNPEKVITEVAAPWVVLMAGSTAMGAAVRAPGWGVLTGLGLGGLPQAVIAVRVHRKRLSDHHVTRRDERPAVIVGIAVSVLTLMAAQRRWGAPSELRRLTDSALICLGIAGGLTATVTKVSLHTAVLSGMVTMLAREVSPRWWAGLIAEPPVAWARVRIGHHTTAQTVLGAAVGLTSGLWARDTL